jgi:outer membrane receptor for monomeric catechols
MADFEERKSRGLGIFVTRDAIAARNTTRLSDVLRDRRGITVVRLSNGRYGVRFVTHSGSRGSGCQPDVWIDGVRARGMELDDIFASTVEALELYDTFSTVPMQFSQQANTVPCGTIVIWTRLPGRSDRDTTRPPE